MRAINKIAVIGFMGSGKSSVAAHLAPQIGLSLFEMDDEIVIRSGFQSIPEIFEVKGEPFFRELEADVARALAERSGLLISTGGGAVELPQNIECLKNNGGLIIYLRTSLNRIVERIGDISNRPLFRDPERVSQLYIRRMPLYESHADLIVDTDERSVAHVCSTIVELLKDAQLHGKIA
jgi:shikimate kinase